MSNLTRRDASATSGGELTTGAQTIAGAKTFTGATTLSGGVQLATSGGTPATLDYYEDATFNIVVNVGVVSAVTLGCRVIRIGKLVTLTITSAPGIIVSGTPSVLQATGTVIPARFSPSSLAPQSFVYVTGTGVTGTSPSVMLVNLTGVVNFYKDINGTAFTNAATYNITPGSTISWLI